MSITGYSVRRSGSIVTVAVTSDLAADQTTVYYHWYVDGAHVGETQDPERDFYIEAGEQVRIEVVDTLDSGFDPIGGAPQGYPARLSLWWVRSTDARVRFYRIEQRRDGGAWEQIGQIPVSGDRWSYQYTTPRLVDGSQYSWQVLPIDDAGNPGLPYTLGDQLIVRRPDAPAYTVAINPDRTLTISEA